MSYTSRYSSARPQTVRSQIDTKPVTPSTVS